MEALSRKDFPMVVGSDDLLDFSLDLFQVEESNTINFSHTTSSVNGASSSLLPPEEELEWLYAFPPVEFGILDDNLHHVGILMHHSPDSLLTNVVNSSGEAPAMYHETNTTYKRAYQGLFQHLPGGFPYFARKKRIGRKPRRTPFANAWDKHLLLLSLVDVRNYRREPPTPIVGGSINGVSTGHGRRCCLHCGTDTTPQWRVGPMGPKTLCNACGVWFHSGRLLPEYRPDCSPTFSARFHSNSHRKIIKMRKQKQVVGMMRFDAL